MQQHKLGFLFSFKLYQLPFPGSEPAKGRQHFSTFALEPGTQILFCAGCQMEVVAGGQHGASQPASPLKTAGSLRALFWFGATVNTAVSSGMENVTRIR